ncbi:MAG: PE family protein [Mycobacterium sp.]
MSFVHAAPEFVTAAASDLASIGANLDSAHTAAVTPTTAILAAGGDEVSEVIATLFAAHAQAYQTLSAQAATFHQQFVQLMNAGAGTYASSEAANAKPLKTLEADISQEEATISRDFANISLQNRLISEAIAKLAQGDMRVLTDEELASKAQLKSMQEAAINTIQSAVTSLNQVEQTMELAIAELAKL